MNTWILVVCIGVFWGGCGGTIRTVFDTKEECYEALGKMHKSEDTTAMCMPKPEE